MEIKDYSTGNHTRVGAGGIQDMGAGAGPRIILSVGLQGSSDCAPCIRGVPPLGGTTQVDDKHISPMLRLYSQLYKKINKLECKQHTAIENINKHILLQQLFECEYNISTNITVKTNDYSYYLVILNCGTTCMYHSIELFKDLDSANTFWRSLQINYIENDNYYYMGYINKCAPLDNT